MWTNNLLPRRGGAATIGVMSAPPDDDTAPQERPAHVVRSATPTIRVAIAEHEMPMLTALAAFGAMVLSAMAPTDAEETAARSGEVQARALAFVTGIPLEALSDEVLEPQLTIIPTREWAQMSRAERRDARLTRIDAHDVVRPEPPEPRVVLCDAQGRPLQ